MYIREKNFENNMRIAIGILFVLFTLSGGFASSPFQHNLNRNYLFENDNDVDNQGRGPGNNTSMQYFEKRGMPYNLHKHPYDLIPELEENYRFSRNFYSGERSEVISRERTPTGVFRTYGKGKVQVARGQTVEVPNMVGRKNAFRNNNAPPNLRAEEGRRQRRGPCITECPEDRTVVAPKASSSVILPEPCPPNTNWAQLSGPKPGTKIREGVHSITGTTGINRRFCEYKYQVVVRRCEPLEAFENDTAIKCSDSNIWGSKCTVFCGPGKEAVGPTELECLEDYKWSKPLTKCKNKTDCPMPKIKSTLKLSCKTTNLTPVEGDFIPNGSICRFQRNEKIVSIACTNGTWKAIRKKNKVKAKMIKKESACKPNPCKNEGTCFENDSNKETPVCVCKSGTHGQFCEYKKCDYNICYNQGLCVLQDEKRVCYCLPEYKGEQCQNYENS